MSASIVLFGNQPKTDELLPLLQSAGYTVQRRADTDSVLPPSQLVILDNRPLLCRQLRPRLSEPAAFLVLLDDPSPAARLACLEAGADGYLLRPFAPRELLLNLAALLRPRQLAARLHDCSTELHLAHQRLSQVLHEAEQDREAARRLQRAFLPPVFPEVPPLRLAVWHRSCGAAGGDSYDVLRLDEDHVGLYLADTMADGVTAGLLTLFLKQALRPKETTATAYRLVPPEEVMTRFNDALLEQRLPETPFLGLLYALVNVRDGCLRFARAGVPAPLYLPSDGAAKRWSVAGSLLGMCAAEFAAQSHQLRPGDKVIIVSDGVRSANADEELLERAAEHRHLPVERLLERLGHDLAGRRIEEDVTFLGLELARSESGAGEQHGQCL